MSNTNFVDIIDVEELDYTEDVFDITVDDNHNFFANGLVVHNCVGGVASGLIYREFPDLKFADLSPDLLTGPAAESAFRNIRGRLDNMIDRFTDCVGRDNFFLEMQFNELSAQHLTNRCLLDASIRTGVQLVSTADSHFPSPDKWQARELYKKLGWIGANLEGQKLPSREEMKTLLYPKNASQMWDEFKRGYTQYDFYRGHEELVKASIERTHDIAWNVCEDAWIDTGAKLPKFDRPEKTGFQQLAELCKDAMIAEGLADKEEYLERIKEELSDVKYLKFENYFLTLYAIFKEAEKETLLGCARGSGGGSLINYLLKITQVDPVEHKLMWSRFLGRHKVSWPDVDCIDSNHLIKTEKGFKKISDVSVGEYIIDTSNNLSKILFKSSRKADPETDTVFDVYVQSKNGISGVIVANGKHRLLSPAGDQIFVDDIHPGDILMSSRGNEVLVVTNKELHPSQDIEIVDITVENSSTFWVVPFDVIEIEKNHMKVFVSIYTYNVDSDDIDKVIENVYKNKSYGSCSP